MTKFVAVWGVFWQAQKSTAHLDSAFSTMYFYMIYYIRLPVSTSINSFAFNAFCTCDNAL